MPWGLHRTKLYDVAYGPYGEDYNGSGTQDLSFTGAGGPRF